MQQNPALPDLSWYLRSLREAVKVACDAKRSRGWLALPMVLLTWMRTRREREEREAALEQFRVLAEAFVALLEDLRAGRLTDGAEPAEEKPAAAARPIVGAGAAVRAERAARGRVRTAPRARDGEMAPALPLAARNVDAAVWADAFCAMDEASSLRGRRRDAPGVRPACPPYGGVRARPPPGAFARNGAGWTGCRAFISLRYRNDQ